MRGSDQSSGNLFSYIDIEERVPGGHPLRVIRDILNETLQSLDGKRLFTHFFIVPRHEFVEL